ncbi:MAG: hypothetical protein QF921_12395 [Pseudomonadales bacterium]|jgi:hypothetical protein|nr:hypothetical protein [Pseudomonadales bacterium]MDP6470838.1 hypothetical protein [Pseudomonadales bacterium]MDP6825977.1 hypothetical protein [Pseudomonadales bacterium]MDP6972289.1 hypothetical protein [Pseudomonadales bacterium]|tara:strand:- start:5124 stop:5396 length:273 start_codon:yes stop_codon:yes gene_type:complete
MSNEDVDLPSGFDWRSITPDDSPLTPMDVMSNESLIALSNATVEPNGPAYDFSSPVFNFNDGREVATNRRFNLLETARKKPVALVFGSYT